MKKKIIVGTIIIIFICVVVQVIYGEYRKSYVKDSPEQILEEQFGITENMCDYEIVDVENRLLRFDYEGYYNVVINVKEEKMDTLIQYFDENYMEIFSEEEYAFIDHSMIKNFTGIEYNENQKVYALGTSMECLRKVEDSSATYRKKHLPLIVIVCYPAIEGKCRIFLGYQE